MVQVHYLPSNVPGQALRDFTGTHRAFDIVFAKDSSFPLFAPNADSCGLSGLVRPDCRVKRSVRDASRPAAKLFSFCGA